MNRLTSLALLALIGATATAQDPSSGSGVAARATISPADDIAFRAMSIPDTVWVGQQATYQVGVFLSDEIRGRLRRNPVFIPPELRSMLAFDLASANSPPRFAGARRYEVHVFQRALFPLTAGIHEIPPARLEYALPLSNSFFAREESHSARTQSLVVVALEPPAVGRPPDYHGAVGRLSLQTRYDQRPQRTGNPFTLTAVVSGIGNVSLLPRPEFALPWADVVPGAVRVQLDSSTTLVRGRKEFDWIVTPLQPGRHTVPPARYPHFNPYTERYEIAFSRPQDVNVTGSPVVVDRSQADAIPVVPLRRAWQGQAPEPLPGRGAFWLVMALAPLPLAGAWFAGRPLRMAPASSPVRQLLEAASAQGADEALVRRIFAGGVAQRVLLSPSEMADRGRFLRALARAGVPDETARRAERLLHELDAAVFGRGSPAAARGAAERAAELLRTIDTEARSRAAIAARKSLRGAGVASVVLLAMLTVAAAPWPRPLAVLQVADPLAQRVFTDGLQAYDDREYGLARQSFHELTQARPRSPDAWLNFGAASWQLQDTAAAVIGWHRALRLQPNARDVRALLRLTPGTPVLWHGVPPVSLTTLALVGGTAWLAAFLALAYALRRRHRTALRGGLALMATAGLVLIAGLYQHEILAGRDASVVLNPTRLRELPVLSGDAGVEALPGEMVHVLVRQGAWTRVRLSDGRRGWVESRSLESIGQDGTPAARVGG